MLIVVSRQALHSFAVPRAFLDRSRHSSRPARQRAYPFRVIYPRSSALLASRISRRMRPTAGIQTYLTGGDMTAGSLARLLLGGVCLLLAPSTAAAQSATTGAIAGVAR